MEVADLHRRVKHGVVWRQAGHDEGVQADPSQVAAEDADNGEDNRFPVNVEGGSPVKEAEHLDGRQLSDSFLNIDVGLFQSRS